MIRIDEIYQNVFLPKALKNPGTGLHWFDPFGSTSIEDICNLPPVDSVAKKRIIFWDQEPLSRDRTDQFLKVFQEIYQSDDTSIVTSEKNSAAAQQISEKFGISERYYFFHAWASLDWYRGYDRTFLSRPFDQRSPDHTFLCPNNIIGGERRHRVEMFKEFVDRDLIKNNLISFPAVCPYEDLSIKELCDKYQIEIDLGSIDLPLVIDDYSAHHNNSHRIDLWPLCDRSLLQVVTETVYHGERQHLTEKTFKPIVMQQPFILVSCRGSLEYLRGYGFRTFGEFWDESYDELDDQSRIKAIGDLLSDIDALSAREKSQLQRHLWPVVEHNFQWFYGREFEQLLWHELTEMIRSW